MRISDWSSDVCSSDLTERRKPADQEPEAAADLRRLGTRLLHRLPQFATELSRALLGARELGFRREESGVKSPPALGREPRLRGSWLYGPRFFEESCKMPRHFLKLSDLSASEARNILERASALKAQAADTSYRPFVGKTLAMIFTKNSTRTRVSFEAGMARYGGHALFLSAGVTQIGRDEPISDTAKVLPRMRSEEHTSELQSLMRISD